MAMRDLKGKRAIVVGLGKSGLAAAKLLQREGAHVAIVDGKTEAQLGETLAAYKGIATESFLGGIEDTAFANRDLIVVSPGVPLLLPALVSARASGTELIGEVELASRFIDEPIAGITGTNGKSTTTALTAHLLNMSGRKAFAGGNLGTPLSQRALSEGLLDVSVCELSSFQLESIVLMRCHAATVLNVTPDHLDRYASLDAYTQAKGRIFKNQQPGDLAALNLSDARVAALPTNSGVERAYFEPRFPSPSWILMNGGSIPGGFKEAEAASAMRIGKRELGVDDQSYTLRARTLRGAHNAENALAATLLARHFGADPESIQRGLDTYLGLPHRLETVMMKDDIEWLNDSKATNVDSVEKSLGAFEPDGAKVILILGGRGKGAPYAPLRPLFANRVKALFTVGEDAARIEAELGDLAPVTSCLTIQVAVAKARALAVSGDVVLLSPACASYDQFKNFEDRGNQFKALVRGEA